MMKYAKILVTFLFVFVASSAVSAQKSNKVKDVYAFGVAASFADSVVYYTPVQVIDGVALDKSGFLPNRELYSYQLKNYFENEMNQSNRVCMIYFSNNKAKLEKSRSKLLAKYRKNKSNSLEQLPADKFKFIKPDLGE